MNSDSKRTHRSNTTADKTSSAGSKKMFDPELESFTKRNFRFQSFTNKQTNKNQKLSVDKVVQKIIIALDHFYQQDTTGFYNNCKQFCTKSWDSWRLKIVDRMNTYEYIQMAVRHKSFAEIETEIIKEWKKNYLLFGIMTFWYNSIQKMKFKTSKEFQSHYNVFRQFISQISYLIFKGWLTTLQKKKISVLDKLCDQTSHFIITDSSEFKKVYEKTLLPLIQNETRHQRINWEFNLNNLNMKSCIYSQKRSQNLSKTIEQLKKFTRQIKLTKKIQSLRQVRITLEKQLIQNQQEQMMLSNCQEVSRKYQILEKDDFLTAFIYCIVVGQVEDIQKSLLYLVILLGQNLNLLSKLQVNSYAIDLIAAVDYLCDQQDSSDLIRHRKQSMDRKLSQSTPLIAQTQSSQFGSISIMSPLTTKNITCIEER